MGLSRRSLTALGSGLFVAVLAISAGVPAQAATTPRLADRLHPRVD